jgi:hypothetical protein
MKQNFYRLVFASVSTLAIAMTGCSKEKIDGSIPTPTTPYLRFADASALKSAIGEISKSTDGNRATVIANVIRAHNGGDGESFRSLLLHPEKNNVVVPSAKCLAALKAKRKSAGPSMAGGAMSREALAADEVITDQLVPDPNFAAVLNDQLELQVGDQLYKVTPEGTYIAQEANRQAMEQMVNDNSLSSADYTPGTLLGDGTYAMGNDIMRYDTYQEDPNSVSLRLLPQDDGTGGGVGTGPGGNLPPSSPCAIKQPFTPAFPGALPDASYCAFPSYLYGAKTVVGGLLQGLFGVNSARENNFDSDHRLSLKLYSFNYKVYASIGLKAKFQEKGIFGIWSKTDCPKIILGWDAVVFEAQQAFSAPGPILPTYNTAGVQKFFVKANEDYKFINFVFPAEMVSELSSVLVGRFGWTQSASSLENDMNNLSATQLASLTEKLWNYVNANYAPSQFALSTSITKGYRLIFPDKVTTALSRWEQVNVNTGEVNLVFDWNTCQLTYKNTIGGSFDLGKNVIAPTYSNKAQSYEVKKASVYGAAQYNGSWKGVRIIQD